MITEFHFLRPAWLLSLIPLVGIFLILWRQKTRSKAWEKICDAHLLETLLYKKEKKQNHIPLLLLALATLFMVISLAGPSWTKFTVPTFKRLQPRVILLSLSGEMLEQDILPNRLTRAKFKLYDLFKMKDAGQFGLIAYTSEPFIVSPLTEDSLTIESMLEALSPDILPVEGNDLNSALTMAEKLIKDAGYHKGDILVLTSNPPSDEAISTAKLLARKGISSSIIPMTKDDSTQTLFDHFAKAGSGIVLPFQSNTADLKHWLDKTNDRKMALASQEEIPVFKDEGRWFLVPALMFLLPGFRRGWLQRFSL